jgi:hypothetical protein
VEQAGTGLVFVTDAPEWGTDEAGRFSLLKQRTQSEFGLTLTDEPLVLPCA